MIAVLWFVAYAVLEAHPFTGPQGEPLLFYLLVDEDWWSFFMFGLGGFSLLIGGICLVRPPLNRITVVWMRRGLKMLLGLVVAGATLCWVAGTFLLLLSASVWNYSAYSSPDGQHVLVATQTYGAAIFTPYRGPFYERQRQPRITDLDAAIGGDCALSSDGSGLALRCGADVLRIPSNM
jgi:hypothetical protein